MDDLVLGFESPEQAWAAYAALRAQVERMGLRLKVSETRLSGVGGGFSFLGFRVWPYRLRLDGARRRRLVGRVRWLSRGAARGALWGEALRCRVEGVSAWVGVGHTRALRVSLWRRRWGIWEGI
jgi:hypothetical protein